MRPTEWVTSLLERHNLKKPDGRLLYQYRINENEFSELADLLKLSTIMGVKNIREMLFWDAVVVIYASEWWRRFYNGQWGWDGIFESIGIDIDELSVVKRNTLIETGLQRWRRPVRYHNGSRMFLGTVATEGGLPLNQLSGSGGWLKQVLQPVLRKHITRGIDISVLIDSYSDWIPNSYQSSEMIQILTDIADIVVSLRKKHQLMEKEAPLKWLDSNQPNWRELFPLPIDDESGRSLLKDLVDTVSTAEQEKHSKNPFEVERFLIRAQSTFPELVAHLEMPTFVPLTSLGQEVSTLNLPATFNIEVFEPNGSIWPWCRCILTSNKEKPALKLSGRSLKLSGVDATKELRLRFTSMGETVHDMELVGGGLLDTKLPWLFRQFDDRWILHGVTSQSIKNKPALVYIPEQSSFEADNESTEINISGHLFDGDILNISGTIQCFSDDIKYKLSAGIEESLTHYQLSGHRHPYHSNPGEVFIGIPDLVETNLVTGTTIRKRGNKLLAKPVGVDTKWQPLSQANTGCYEVRLYDADDYIQLRKRIGILNSDFTANIRPDKNKVSSGSIHLASIENCQVNIAHTEKQISAHIQQSNTSTEVQLVAENSPPLSVDISLLPNGHKRELLLRFPFPSKGALLFDKNNRSIPFSTQLYLSDLMGYRIKVFDNKYFLMNQVDLSFSLVDTTMSPDDLKDLYTQRKMTLKGEVTEFSIFNWMESIDSLMSISTSLDSMVRISMTLHGQEEFRLDIRRYENEILAKWNEGSIEFDTETVKQLSNDILEETHISTLFLNQPEQSNTNLEALSSENALIGRWNFSPEKRHDGPWLIYPHKDSKVTFRPLLWNVGAPEELGFFDIESFDTLAKAICVSDQGLRNDAISQVLKLMAGNLKHKSWSYLSNLWQKSNHLPMATFDVWKLAINEMGFLACLFINENDDIIDRLEAELPLIWELAHLNDWLNALQLYKDKISEILADDEELVEELIHKKIQKIESLGLSMVSIGQILRKNLLNKESPELSAMRQNGKELLKLLVTPLYQDLLRRQAESEWPILLQTLIKKKCQELPNNYIQLLETHNNFHQSVVYLPLILAFRALSENQTDWPSSASELFKIKELKRFDEDWFSTVFQLLSGWISQQKNLELI